MKLNTFAPQKTRAQAMVEFAIVLPLLLLLLYGILEAGRLLFMYSTIVTATRQASRYGSATGQGGDYTSIGGPDNRAYPRYQDCYGIRLAADRVDFLNSFDPNTDISIVYDNGEGTPVTGWDGRCDGPADPDVEPSTNNDTRIVVTVEGNFFPIVPRLVPFIERSDASPSGPITATSARTIIIAISIEVTPPPGTAGVPTAGTNQLSLSMVPSRTTYAFPGDVADFVYTLTNNGDVDLTGLTFAATYGGMNCPSTTIAAHTSMTCTGSYTIQPGDVGEGKVVSVEATATGYDPTSVPVPSNPIVVKLTWELRLELQLTKSASTEYAGAGNIITYTFTLTNSGNVPLTAPTVSDPRLGAPFACGSDMPPQTSTGCTANYTVTADDVDDNPLVNTATASAMYGTQPVNTTSSASVTVWTGPLFLRASASPTSLSAPGTITYTYELINNTGVPLSPPYSLSGHRGSENCSTNTSSIPVGGSITCTGTHTVTQTELDNTASLNNNSIRATGCTDSTNCNGPRRVTSNNDSVSVTLVRTPSISMTIASVTPNPATTLGTVITYTYTVTNTGNVTLTPTITDTKVTSVSCPGALAPGATYNCIGTYTVTQADLDAGSITNQATATATFSSQSVSSASQSVTVITYPGPRVRLGITPNPSSFTGVGQFIVYTYTLTNTGDRLLYGPYIVSDSKVIFIDCAPATSPLAIGASTTCVGSYATTQADMDTGHITNSASITASDGTQVVTSNSATAVVYVPGAPTLTPIPGPTATPTPTRTPTTPPTAVLGCGNITGGDITTPTDTMVMTITNPNAYAVTVSSVAVTWNRPGGAGGDLTLQSARLGNTTFWTGSNTTGSLTITPAGTLTIPANSTPVITFTFNRNYQTENGEAIAITLSTPGCESVTIRNQP